MILQILFLVLFAFECQSRVVRPHGKCENNVCHFELNVDYKFTMMWYNYTNIREPQFNPVVIRDGLLQRRVTNVACRDNYIPLSREEFHENVSPGDGNYKLALAFNGQIPGPDMVVYEDQIVSVYVHNLLEVEGVTIHWHGIIQRGTPFMDGVDMITQCPILPKQTFEYRFLASPVGTHWYHAHTGTMRSDGLAGALIVLPRIRPPIRIPREPVPNVDTEFSVVLMDWMRQTAKEKMQAVRGRFAVLDEFDGDCLPFIVHPDGSGKLFQLHTGLVNGRGKRYILNDPKVPEKPYIPLETFTVEQNRYYRFRVINAGFEAAFEISVDGHMLLIVAVDGNEVEPFRTDIMTISVGESCDFIIFTGQPRANYHINFFTTPTRVITGEEIVTRKRTYGILNYRGVDANFNPITLERECTRNTPCLAVNQVYGLYPASENTISVPLTRLRSTEWTLRQNPVPIVGPGDRKQLFFLNFHFFPTDPVINGVQFRKPTSVLQTIPGRDAIVPCGPDTCTAEGCRCTQMLKLDLGNVIEMVLFSFSRVKKAHPVHLHGHQFHVLKIGYPPYDPVTGNATAQNPDIRCLDQACTRATWADPSWRHGNIPGLNLINPPIKDTVVIPANGYVIIRLNADNPGFWFMHCHLTHHQINGMNLVMQEGDIQDMPPVPPNFPTCNNFLSNLEQWLTSLKRQEAILLSKGIKPSFTSGAVLQGHRNSANLCKVFPWQCRKPMYS
ncbi:uncharacterized protein LOC133176053 [Saccostrea echinata]|uniref:uncharacterized protein LOC133176053 n=1 Tax=Saccostrea echinata TaxID=191078 RepID=UPI002A81BBFD|nr:uncharacterized protein LOC133176053 [Saccostrea echinata]